MHRVRSLGILSASIVAVALIGCGDDGTWGGKTPPPLNAGPGVNALYTPESSGGGGGGSIAQSILGDWFLCKGEGTDPCNELDRAGLGFRAGGVLVLLYGLQQAMVPGGPYCEGDTLGWTLDGDLVTIGGEGQFSGFSLHGDRATWTEGSKAKKKYAIRQSNSQGACQFDGPGAGPG